MPIYFLRLGGGVVAAAGTIGAALLQENALKLSRKLDVLFCGVLNNPAEIPLNLPPWIACKNRNFAKGVAGTVSLPISSVFFCFLPCFLFFFSVFFLFSVFFRFFFSVSFSEKKKTGRHRSRDPFCETPKKAKETYRRVFCGVPREQRNYTSPNPQKAARDRQQDLVRQFSRGSLLDVFVEPEALQSGFGVKFLLGPSEF